MKEYHLFIDESGSHSFGINSDLYILCGLAINSSQRNQLKIKADQIKYKYWGNTDIVFHSRDISLNQKEFSIFINNEKLKKEFLKDLFSLLNSFSFMIFPVILDKKLAEKRRWGIRRILTQTSNKLFFHYLCFLLTQTKCKGSVTIESATSEKDSFYLTSFSYFLAPNCKEFPDVDYKIRQDKLTSISFVTKKNNDIEEQIADIFAYAIKCNYEKIHSKHIFSKNSYEDRIIKILNSKLYTIPATTKENKRKFLKQIESFCVIPKEIK